MSRASVSGFVDKLLKRAAERGRVLMVMEEAPASQRPGLLSRLSWLDAELSLLRAGLPRHVPACECLRPSIRSVERLIELERKAEAEEARRKR